MKTDVFTHPNASFLAVQDKKEAINLVKGKSKAKVNGRIKNIAKFKSNAMHSQEASRFELLDEDEELIAFFCNGQFWAATNKSLVELF